MVLHLPGSMSIMALITLSKESISLFSFLLHAPQPKHRRKLKSSSNAVWLCVTDTFICSQPDQNKMTREGYLRYNPLSIHINFLLHSNMMCGFFLIVWRLMFRSRQYRRNFRKNVTNQIAKTLYTVQSETSCHVLVL